MLIQQKFIQKVSSHLNNIANGSKIIVGIRNAMDYRDKLIKMGFQNDLTPNQTILPYSKIGNTCFYNSEGKYIKLTDRPKETFYTQVEWTRNEFRGRDVTEEVTDFVDIPHHRFPRRFTPPSSLEFSLISIPQGYFVTSPTFTYELDNYDLIKTAINMMLEIFGFCEIFTESLDEINAIKTVRVNWVILPQGDYPWERIRELIEPMVRLEKPKIRPVITDRIKTLEDHKPNFRVQGFGGFKGYLIYGFPNKNLYFCESIHYGNATYVFENDWEALSKMTKAQILNEGLQFARAIHIKGWKQEINRLLS